MAAGSALHRDTPEPRFDLTYSEHNASNRPVATGQQSTPVQIDGGNASFWSASGNLAYYVPLAYGVRGYAIGGGGAYGTRVELTQAVPFFGDFICDPFSGFCDGAWASLTPWSRRVTLRSSAGMSVWVWSLRASTDSPGSSKPVPIASLPARRSNIYRS